MPGPAPAEKRRRRNVPARGDWKPAPGEGWQHGEIPAPPDGLLLGSLEAWVTWFSAWFAVHWTKDMLPGLRLVILAYDEVLRGGVKAADRTALHALMRAYGITPDGQSALRWAPPKPEEAEPSQSPKRPLGAQYEHLKVVGE